MAANTTQANDIALQRWRDSYSPSSATVHPRLHGSAGPYLGAALVSSRAVNTEPMSPTGRNGLMGRAQFVSRRSGGVSARPQGRIKAGGERQMGEMERPVDRVHALNAALRARTDQYAQAESDDKASAKKSMHCEAYCQDGSAKTGDHTAANQTTPATLGVSLPPGLRSADPPAMPAVAGTPTPSSGPRPPAWFARMALTTSEFERFRPPSVPLSAAESHRTVQAAASFNPGACSPMCVYQDAPSWKLSSGAVNQDRACATCTGLLA